MLQQLRNMNAQRMDVDDAMELVTIARMVATSYSVYSVTAPQWLKDGIELLDREIKNKHRDMLEANQRELQSRLRALMTRDEKRAALEAELAKVTAALGNAPAAQ